MKARTNSSCVMVFVKAPIPGMVKTRLAAVLGPDHAANLYACFAKDVIRSANHPDFNLKIFYHPPGSKKLIKKLLGNEVDYSVQSGKNLGEKMANAFRKVFSDKFTRAVLIGSDIPDLPGRLISEALSVLTQHDAVIGPSVDGGFYLIGFRSGAFNGDIFKNISWSTDLVYAHTFYKMAAHGLDIHILPKWRDIDTCEDLVDLAASFSSSKTLAEETKKYLKRIWGSGTLESME